MLIASTVDRYAPTKDVRLKPEPKGLLSVCRGNEYSRTPFEITTLSRDPEGDQADGLSPAFERLDTFHVGEQTLEQQLERVELRPGFKVWLVSADSVAMIPKAHQAVAETPFEKKLPQQLVTFEILDTPVWRWIALLVMAFEVWMVAGFLS